jgi:hypothetical protein
MPTSRGGLSRKVEAIMSLVFRAVGFEGKILYSCEAVQQPTRKRG